jgi:hypothetical protein
MSLLRVDASQDGRGNAEDSSVVLLDPAQYMVSSSAYYLKIGAI